LKRVQRFYGLSAGLGFGLVFQQAMMLGMTFPQNVIVGMAFQQAIIAELTFSRLCLQG
jgi:hypothetical protein